MITCASFWLSIIPALITASAIVGVGWWVNTAIRKKNKKDNILVNHLQGLQKEIYQFIKEAVDADRLEVCTTKLRGLSNEIQHLTDLYEQLCINESKKKQAKQNLEDAFFDLKRNLTTTGNIARGEDREHARQKGNQLREVVLKVMFDACESTEQFCL